MTQLALHQPGVMIKAEQTREKAKQREKESFLVGNAGRRILVQGGTVGGESGTYWLFSWEVNCPFGARFGTEAMRQSQYGTDALLQCAVNKNRLTCLKFVPDSKLDNILLL